MLTTIELINNHAGQRLTPEYLVRAGIALSPNIGDQILTRIKLKQDRYGITIVDNVIHTTDAYYDKAASLVTDPTIWSVNTLGKRWGCYGATVHNWLWGDNRAAMAKCLVRGLTDTECHDLIPPRDLEAVCHSRGFSIKELCRHTGLSVNTVKSWSRSEKRVVRFWDLIRGYSNGCVNGQ